jgi:hypothetical protein
MQKLVRHADERVCPYVHQQKLEFIDHTTALKNRKLRCRANVNVEMQNRQCKMSST